MFKFKQLLEDDFETIAGIVTTEHGKTLDESLAACAAASNASRSPAVHRRC